jgi:hypothetical protein
MKSSTSNTHLSPAAAVLWASAFVIAALIIVQAGRLPGNAAHAHMTAERGSYTLLTCDSGKGGQINPNELLYIIDSRDQMLLLYEVEDARKKQILLRDGGNLDTLFNRARQ